MGPMPEDQEFPYISLLIPAFNAEQTIEETVRQKLYSHHLYLAIFRSTNY